jgi:hypothetical protein
MLFSFYNKNITGTHNITSVIRIKTRNKRVPRTINTKTHIIHTKQIHVQFDLIRKIPPHKKLHSISQNSFTLDKQTHINSATTRRNPHTTNSLLQQTKLNRYKSVQQLDSFTSSDTYKGTTQAHYLLYTKA